MQWPKNTSFLFGPRGTGKSTWIKKQNQDVYLVDLLDTKLMLSFEKDPALFRQQVLGEARQDQWIVVDEIQKLPVLLDEVQLLIENKGYRHFLLTGSSARKLRMTSVNLLGGRARNLLFFPLTAAEIGFGDNLYDNIQYGCLPTAVIETDHFEKEQYLTGYIANYIVDEIKRESQIRNVAGFQRFLEIAAICSTKAVNQSNIARDAGVSRDSVRLYYEVLVDTLIGFWLPVFRERVKVKEVASPKFYFFDSGVLNAAAGYFRQPSPSDWHGVLFETWIAHELHAFMQLKHIKGDLSYWGTPSETEVDFVWHYGNRIVLMEVKHSRDFRSSYLKGIKAFQKSRPEAKGYLIYLGEKKLDVDGISIFPARDFLKLLYQGSVIGTP